MKQIKTLNDLYSQPFLYGIIYDMFKDEKFADIFTALSIDEDGAHSLDVDYIYNNSGLKSISTLIQGLLNEYVVDENFDIIVDNKGNRITYDKFINDIDKRIIRTIIYHKYFLKWKNLISTLFVEYDVTSPYNMTIGDDVKFDKTTDDNKNGTYKSDGGRGGSITREGNSADKTYGFNSVNSVPVDDYNNSETTTEGYSDSRQDSSTDIGKSVVDSKTHRDITRKGNIGNRSVTELIEEQRKMLTYQVFTEIYSDLDDVLTRSKYI